MQVELISSSLAILREQQSSDGAQCYDYMTIDVCLVPFYHVNPFGRYVATCE
jgi:hypothetical protein